MASALITQPSARPPVGTTAVDLRQRIAAWHMAGCHPAEAAPIWRDILTYIRGNLFPSANLHQEMLRIESSSRYSDLAKLRRAADLLERAQGASLPMTWGNR